MTENKDVQIGQSYYPDVSNQPKLILDHDALLLVFGFVEHAKDMLNLLKTCKTFYNIGRPNFLGCPLRFKGAASRSKFQAFMAYIKENPSAVQHVKYLSIIDIPEDQAIVRNFVLEFLQKGTSLEFLRVSLPTPLIKWIRGRPRKPPTPPLPDIVPASCPKLEHLNLCNLDSDDLVKIFQCLDAPLKYLSISLRDPSFKPSVSKRIMYQVQKFTPTLEHLQLAGVSWDSNFDEDDDDEDDEEWVTTDEEQDDEENEEAGHDDADDAEDPGVVEEAEGDDHEENDRFSTWDPTTLLFPKLHTFIIQHTYVHSAANIVRACPNLKNFITSCHTLGPRMRHLADMKNVQEYDQMWTSLDSLHINADSLYRIGLQCPVNYLDLYTDEGRFNFMDEPPHVILMVQAILNSIQPPRFKLSVTGDMLESIVQHRRSQEFYQLFSYSALTHFSLDVTPRFKFTDRLETFIAEYLKALENNHSIKTLCLTLRWELSKAQQLFKGDEIRIQPSYITAKWNPRDLAMKMISAVGPSVKYVVLHSVETWKSTNDNRVFGWDGWRVNRGVDDGTVTLEKLRRNECGRVMDARELR
ncbi:hypothetical protein C8Q75DRAFT_730596 [Abortiporus biennis]|nr:hypothetical protein C8Q75DRAFT_730596 [Abortiporus biennis]